jgi:hypothetical protein
VRLSDGRPARVPQELVDVVRGATAATLREHPSFLQDLRRLL